ncbi:unnamed protein product, partial [Closterium sp. NIES-54]
MLPGAATAAANAAGATSTPCLAHLRHVSSLCLPGCTGAGISSQEPVQEKQLRCRAELDGSGMSSKTSSLASASSISSPAFNSHSQYFKTSHLSDFKPVCPPAPSAAPFHHPFAPLPTLLPVAPAAATAAANAACAANASRPPPPRQQPLPAWLNRGRNFGPGTGAGVAGAVQSWPDVKIGATGAALGGWLEKVGKGEEGRKGTAPGLWHGRIGGAGRGGEGGGGRERVWGREAKVPWRALDEQCGCAVGGDS